MRILSIGFPLPNPSIDNYTFLQAPSFDDYDAVLVEPAQISRVIEDVLTRAAEHQTYSGEPVLNEPSGPFVTGLADHLERRRGEVERLLAAGKLLIIFTRPNVPHSHVLGLPGYDRYAWLPAPAGVSYRPPHLLPADGRGAAVVDDGHPLSDMLARFQNWFTYRAIFSERLAAFPDNGSVLMRSPGGAPIGVELRVGAGRIVFLPALEDVPAGDSRFELATLTIDAVKGLIGGETEADAPAWAREYTLPGLDTIEAEQAEAESVLTDARNRVEEIRARASDLAGLRRLLWAEGQYALEPAVRHAFELLGFEVEPNPERPAVLRADGRTAFLEVEGSREAVDQRVYIRLQRRVEKDLLTTREAKKGIAVVNGRRRRAPGDRVESYTEPLRAACEANGFALITGPRLFDLVRGALDADDDTRRALREEIWAATGVL